MRITSEYVFAGTTSSTFDDDDENRCMSTDMVVMEHVGESGKDTSGSTV